MNEGPFGSVLVSIIINNHNYERFLGEAIESALNQTYPNIEVIVVDDGSTDNSCEIIDSYRDKIIPLFKENGGQVSACNAGFAESNGEIVIFLDADNSLLPDTVGRVVTAFKTHPSAAKVQYRMQVSIHAANLQRSSARHTMCVCPAVIYGSTSLSFARMFGHPPVGTHLHPPYCVRYFRYRRLGIGFMSINTSVI